jgi:hypothetical protein
MNIRLSLHMMHLKEGIFCGSLAEVFREQQFHPVHCD